MTEQEYRKEQTRLHVAFFLADAANYGELEALAVGAGRLDDADRYQASRVAAEKIATSYEAKLAACAPADADPETEEMEVAP